MQKQKLVFSFLAAVLILGGGCGAKSSSTEYTLDEVAKHESTTNCWTAISGNVYDLTSFIAQHPGGVDSITFLCGKDGTEAMTAQHGDLNANKTPQKELAGLKIGVLKK